MESDSKDYAEIIVSRSSILADQIWEAMCRTSATTDEGFCAISELFFILIHQKGFELADILEFCREGFLITTDEDDDE